MASLSQLTGGERAGTAYLKREFLYENIYESYILMYRYEYMGGIRQEGKRPKNCEFYSLRIGFS